MIQWESMSTINSISTSGVRHRSSTTICILTSHTQAAKFCQDLSHLPGLFDDTHYLLMHSKRQALVHYVTHLYLAELKNRGYHVLYYTIPVWKQNPNSPRCNGIFLCQLRSRTNSMVDRMLSLASLATTVPSAIAT